MMKKVYRIDEIGNFLFKGTGATEKDLTAEPF